MKTASAKAKGRKLQQWVRDLLLKLSGLPSSDIRSTGMGQTGSDIQLAQSALALWPLSIECKNLARVAALRWLEQAEAYSTTDTVPIVVVKENHGKPVVLVDAEYFFKLVYNNNKE